LAAFWPEAIAMARLTLALAVWMCLVPAARATLGARREQPAFEKMAPRGMEAALPAQIVGRALPLGDRPEFVVTEQTKVLLDGKPCRYESVPAQAIIVGIEVAADKKTAISIRFRTPK
jgi:hypothetical protein